MIGTTVSPKIAQAMATTVTRHNSSRQERLGLFHKAVDIVKSATQWRAGESKTVFSGKLNGKKAEVYLRNESNSARNPGINLYLLVEGGSLLTRFTSEPFKVGYFNPMTGFQVSVEATEAGYLTWNLKVRRALG